jgi:hypothetical protein
MKNDLIAEVYDVLGGAVGFSRWARSHKAAFYAMYVKTDTQPQAPQAEPDSAELAGLIEDALAGVINARGDRPAAVVTSIMDDGSIDVCDVVAGAAQSKNPTSGFCGDNSDTPSRTIEDVPAPQPLLTQSKSDDAIAKTDVAKHAARKPAQPSNVVGVYGAQANGGDVQCSPDDYGRNWSQNIAPRGW